MATDITFGKFDPLTNPNSSSMMLTLVNRFKIYRVKQMMVPNNPTVIVIQRMNDLNVFALENSSGSKC